MPNTNKPKHGSEDDEGHRESNPHREMVRWTRAVALFTFLLFVANAVSNFFIYEQWKVASDAQTDTREQLRAVVTLSQGNQFVSTDKDGKPTFYSIAPVFQNTGGTRTAKFFAWTSLHYFEKEVPNSHDFSKPWNKVDLSYTVIGPNGVAPIPAVAVTQEEVLKTFEQKGVIVWWGHAEYSDIFQPEVLHPISFCLLVTPTNKTTNGQILLQSSPYRADCNRS
jgi:hypothetical protein